MFCSTGSLPASYWLILVLSVFIPIGVYYLFKHRLGKELGFGSFSAQNKSF